MKTASIKEIKDTLQDLGHSQLTEICLRLSKFKKENKELLTYLLFEAHDETAYINNVKSTLDDMFAEVNKKNLYYAKKNIRKILRTANKYIRYSGNDITEPEILLYVAHQIVALGLDIKKSQTLANLYNGILKKIDKSISSLHEDIQYDLLKHRQQLHSV